MVEMFPDVAEKGRWIRGDTGVCGPEVLRGIGDKGPPFDVGTTSW